MRQGRGETEARLRRCCGEFVTRQGGDRALPSYELVPAMFDLRSQLVMLLLIGLPSQVHAAPGFAAQAPRFDAVKQVLCPLYKLNAARCKASSFDAPLPIDLDGDKRAEWIYVLRRGPLKICFVRHACFTLLERRGRRWRAVLTSMGGTIAFYGRSAHAARRDLVVTAANSSCERQHALYVSKRGRYRQVRSASCASDGCQSATAEVVRRSKTDRLCTALTGDVVLQ
jgi:hypothetical protein